MSLKSVLFFTFLFFNLLILQGQKLVDFKLLDDKSGLSDRKILMGFEDNIGFLWFTSSDGLQRYDGHRFVNFNKKNSSLRSDKVILAIYVEKGILVLHGKHEYHSRSAGLVDFYDFNSNKIIPFNQAIPHAPFDEAKVIWMTPVQEEGVLFMLSDGSFYIMNKAQDFTLIFQKPSRISWEDYANINFFISNEWLVLSMPYRDQHLIVDRSDKDNQLMLYGRWHMVWEDGQQVMYNQSKVGLISYTIGKKNGIYLQPLSTNPYGSAAVNFHYNDPRNQKSIWFIPQKGFYRKLKDGLSCILDSNQLGIHEESINSYFEDSMGNIWICTTNGIYQIKLSEAFFESFLNKPPKETPSIVDQTRGIYDDGKCIWINQWDNIICIDKSSRNIKKYKAPYKGINYALNQVNGKIHVGGAGIAFLNSDMEFTLIQSLATLECWALEPIDDRTALVGTNNGLYKLDSNSKSLSEINPVSVESPEHIYRIRKANNSFLIVANNGIYSYTSHTKLTPLVLAKTLNGMSFHDAILNTDSTLLIATNDSGLIQYNFKQNTSKKYGFGEGLTAESLYRIEPGKEGFIWISSDNGLYAFNEYQQTFVRYSEKEGLPMNEFNRGSSYSHFDGSVYFGGINGIISFHKDSLPKSNLNRVKNLMLSEAHIENTSQHIQKITFHRDEVFQFTFSREIRSLKLLFSTLDFNSVGYTYGYFIEGYDSQWRYDKMPEITISGLPYGAYTVKVKAINADGTSITEKTIATLENPYPLYLKWWFLIVTIGGIVLIVYLLVKLRIKALKNERQILQNLVNEQTKDLLEALDFKDFLLQEIHHRIKNNLALMDGMIELQMDGSTEFSTVKALQQTQLRLRSISMLNQNLYYSDRETTIDLKNFFSDFNLQFSAMLEEKRALLEVYVDTETKEISSRKAIPIGLIYNELITNSLKYAKVKDQSLRLNIHITQKERILSCKYSDNGAGTIHFDLTRSNTLGIRLIRMFCRQLKTQPTIDIEHGFKMMFDIDLSL